MKYNPVCSQWDCGNNLSGFCTVMHTEIPMMEIAVSQCTENENQPYLGHLKDMKDRLDQKSVGEEKNGD